MTRELDSSGTRILSAVGAPLATLARLSAIALAVPATLTLIQASGRALTGEFPIARGAWAFDLMYTYVSGAQHLFNEFSPRQFSDLAPTIQGLLVFIPNLVLVLLGIWSLIGLAKAAFKR
jgi:hypothetical protein